MRTIDNKRGAFLRHGVEILDGGNILEANSQKIIIGLPILYFYMSKSQLFEGKQENLLQDGF